MEVPTSNHVNTVNMTETDHEDSTATNQILNMEMIWQSKDKMN